MEQFVGLPPEVDRQGVHGWDQFWPARGVEEFVGEAALMPAGFLDGIPGLVGGVEGGRLAALPLELVEKRVVRLGLFGQPGVQESLLAAPVAIVFLEFMNGQAIQRAGREKSLGGSLPTVHKRTDTLHPRGGAPAGIINNIHPPP
ncbi:hypothetical protein, partial [Ralstonia solanacearum]|uniref:hypothetical protein n=1 Tax=Ralstonia solanacearum TaxID=305 RepID=UPI0019D39BEE